MNKYLFGVVVHLILSTSALAATVAPSDLQKLVVDARRDGATPVTIHLAPVSLLQMEKDFPRVKAEMNSRAAVLIKELGATVWEAGRWNSGMGQIGLYVTEAGLNILGNSANAISFRPDRPWEHSSLTDAKREEIENRLRQHGFVDVDVTWSVEGLQYDVDASANVTLRMTGIQRNEARSKAGAALQKLTRVQGPDRDAAQAAINNAIDTPTPLRVDREGLLKLVENKDVRHLAPRDFKGKSQRYIDKNALAEAVRSGSAEVIISVLDPMPAGRAASKASDDERIKVNQRSIDALLQIAGASASSRAIPEFAAIVVRLSANGLRALEASSDKRLLAVGLNRPIAYANTSTSLQSINAPHYWQSGYRGAGQYIVVMDTGVKSTHPMFKNASGQSRIAAEGCYGSNLDGYVSICPEADAWGDSPPGRVGSAAAPPEDCSSIKPNACHHGTHVAGIAAGQIVENRYGGVAPEASIVPIQVFSFDPHKTKIPTAYDADILAALQMLYPLTSAGTTANPITVNMSLGSEMHFGSCYKEWDGVEYVFNAAIKNLYDRNVPVIASVGNSSWSIAISFPACLPKVIKVGSVSNDGRLATRSTFSNMPILSYFPGEFFFMAPGDPIFSAGIGGGTRRMSGTSQAAPHVAGVYAVVKAGVPTATIDDISKWLTTNSPRTVEGIPVLRMPNL